MIDTITQYILAIVPAVTAIMGMIVVIGVGIGKIKKAINGNEIKVEEATSKKTKVLIEQNQELKKQNAELAEQNIQLKQLMCKIDSKLDGVKVVKGK